MKEQEVQKFIDEAAAWLDKGDRLSAAKVYLKGFEATNDWKFANEAGVCFQQESNFEEANNAFQLALPIAPDRYFVLFNIGINFSMIGNYERAKEALREIWEENLNPRAAFEMGYIEMREKNWEGALEIFDKAMFYDYTLNQYNMSGSEGLDPELAARVFLNKARIFGFELNREEEAKKMIECLKDELDDENRLFTFAQEAVDHGKTELAKYAAIRLNDFYADYEDVEEFCKSLGVVPE